MNISGVVEKSISSLLVLMLIGLWNPYKTWLLASPSSRFWTFFVGLAFVVYLLVRVTWLGIRTGWVAKSQASLQYLKSGRTILNGLWWLAIVAATVQVAVYGYSLLGEHRQLKIEKEKVVKEQQLIEKIANSLTTTQKIILLAAYTSSRLPKSDVKTKIMEDQIRSIREASTEIGVPLLIFSGERLVERGLLRETKYLSQQCEPIKLSMETPEKGKAIGIMCVTTPLGTKVGEYLFHKYPALIPDEPKPKPKPSQVQ